MRPDFEAKVHKRKKNPITKVSASETKITGKLPFLGGFLALPPPHFPKYCTNPCSSSVVSLCHTNCSFIHCQGGV